MGTATARQRPRQWLDRVCSRGTSGKRQSRDDPRITSRFAAFCRRHSIDEMPQFWHVLRGEMSLVGPRPLTRIELLSLLRLARFGAGLRQAGVDWTLAGLRTQHHQFPERAALDLKLVRELTPKMYLTILLRTISTLIGGQGAW